jgi:hypothetical protein
MPKWIHFILIFLSIYLYLYINKYFLIINKDIIIGFQIHTFNNWYVMLVLTLILPYKGI